MYVCVLRAKLHNLRVTGTRLDYAGSLSVDAALLEAAGLFPYEQVQVYNVNTGARFETYLIPAPAGSRTAEVNGAAARLAEVGDRLIVAAYAWVAPDTARHVRPRILILDDANEVLQRIGE
ncbi:Aspartate 1-decarboxylase [bacterium HR11]|nr:Aspartate 1-decarboxylase [bacterium HR11]